MVSPEMLRACLACWVCPERPPNWISAMFFGASMNVVALDFLRDMVLAAAQVECDEPGEDIRGLFHVDIEDDISRSWKVLRGRIEERRLDAEDP